MLLCRVPYACKIMQSQPERTTSHGGTGSNSTRGGTRGSSSGPRPPQGSVEMVSGSGIRLNGSSRSGGMLLAEIAIGLKVITLTVPLTCYLSFTHVGTYSPPYP